MPKPVCIACKQFFKPHKCGTYWIEGMPRGNGAPRGNAAPEQWQPYKLWSGDTYKCDGCGTEIIVGAGSGPISVQHEDSFRAWVTQLRPVVQVNDC